MLHVICRAVMCVRVYKDSHYISALYISFWRSTFPTSTTRSLSRWLQTSSTWLSSRGGIFGHSTIISSCRRRLPRLSLSLSRFLSVFLSLALSPPSHSLYDHIFYISRSPLLHFCSTSSSLPRASKRMRARAYVSSTSSSSVILFLYPSCVPSPPAVRSHVPCAEISKARPPSQPLAAALALLLLRGISMNITSIIQHCYRYQKFDFPERPFLNLLSVW